ncbi:hypothetical protein JAAARDRAFT_259853 [Jaapia argillacea MUCL 33604]|uniref:Uncharacterized protein n=1 Tax=Jaapia argillacea MUCL 33604 TaxID=933084 RepID=A0A067PWE0_9AGAM|nr:hypothetical protein JAAARDRAFT_259853 [Jaapia argillacea MUCL 33604]
MTRLWAVDGVPNEGVTSLASYLIYRRTPPILPDHRYQTVSLHGSLNRVSCFFARFKSWLVLSIYPLWSLYCQFELLRGTRTFQRIGSFSSLDARRRLAMNTTPNNVTKVRSFMLGLAHLPSTADAHSSSARYFDSRIKSLAFLWNPVDFCFCVRPRRTSISSVKQPFNSVGEP